MTEDDLHQLFLLYNKLYEAAEGSTEFDAELSMIFKLAPQSLSEWYQYGWINGWQGEWSIDKDTKMVTLLDDNLDVAGRFPPDPYTTSCDSALYLIGKFLDIDQITLIEPRNNHSTGYSSKHVSKIVTGDHKKVHSAKGNSIPLSLVSSFIIGYLEAEAPSTFQRGILIR